MSYNFSTDSLKKANFSLDDLLGSTPRDAKVIFATKSGDKEVTFLDREGLKEHANKTSQKIDDLILNTAIIVKTDTHTHVLGSNHMKAHLEGHFAENKSITVKGRNGSEVIHRMNNITYSLVDSAKLQNALNKYFQTVINQRKKQEETEAAGLHHSSYLNTHAQATSRQFRQSKNKPDAVKELVPHKFPSLAVKLVIAEAEALRASRQKQKKTQAIKKEDKINRQELARSEKRQAITKESIDTQNARLTERKRTKRVKT